MRLHKAESAFFLFIAMVFGAGILLFFAYGTMRTNAALLATDDLTEFAQLLLSTGILLGTATVFGIFFIYPLIRTQVREEGKLRAITQSLSARSESLQHAALTDSLTGTHNRRYFDDALKEYLTEFGRIAKPVGLMVIDLDRFKAVNDTYGHDIGDEVLRQVSHSLKDMTRYHDVVARLGGEEFSVVAPNMSEDALVKLAERIRAAIASLAIEVDDLRLRVTVSIGLAVWDGKESADGFFRRADKMLYQAKRLGRNRVCI